MGWKLLFVVGALVVIAGYGFILWRGSRGLVNRDGSRLSRTQWRHIALLIVSGAIVVGVSEGLATGLHIASDTATSIVAGAAIGGGVWFVLAFFLLASRAAGHRRAQK